MQQVLVESRDSTELLNNSCDESPDFMYQQRTVESSEDAELLSQAGDDHINDIYEPCSVSCAQHSSTVDTFQNVKLLSKAHSA